MPRRTDVQRYSLEHHVLIQFSFHNNHRTKQMTVPLKTVSITQFILCFRAINSHNCIRNLPTPLRCIDGSNCSSYLKITQSMQSQHWYISPSVHIEAQALVLLSEPKMDIRHWGAAATSRCDEVCSDLRVREHVQRDLVVSYSVRPDRVALPSSCPPSIRLMPRN